MKNTVKKNDLRLLAFLALTGMLLAVFTILYSGRGSRVLVSVDGQNVESFSLNTDSEHDILGVNGGVNHLVIKNGSAYVDYADCPDGVCVHTGKISRTGQSIICLPHKLVISIEGKGNTSDTIDAIVGGAQ